MADELLAGLDRKVHAINLARPLPPASLQSLRDWLRVEATYTSNGIDGNSLTRQEARVALEGMMVG